MPLKLHKRGKIWHYQGTVAGKFIRGSTTTSNKETAQRIAADIEQRAWKGHLDPHSTVTFADAVTLYRRAGKADRFVWIVAEYWGATPIKNITQGAIRTAAIELYPDAAGATRNRQVIVPTQAVINHAASHDLCRHIRVERFEVKKKVKEPATWEWVQSFMAAATKPNLAALACFMYLTGARISQALAVQWDDIDWKSGKVLIRATQKGDDDRKAHMPSELIAALANIGGGRSGLVFSFKSRGNCRTQWSGAIRRAGIGYLSYHSCRHGFATGLLDRGVSPVTVAKRGGWKSPQHVFQTYGHDIASDSVTDVLTGAPITQTQKRANENK